MFNLGLFLTAVFIVIDIGNGETPPFITKCNAEDSECLKETTNAFIPLFASGIPQYNVEKLDPVFIKAINATQGNLIFLVNDVTVTGLKDCVAKGIQLDTEKLKINLRLLCTCKLDGHYILRGSVLIFPLRGNGKIHVDLNTADLDIVLNMVIKDNDDGSKHWTIETFDHSFELKDKSVVVFENLYHGNEILGRAARELVANKGNDVIKEIGSPVISAVISRVVNNINQLFEANKIEDLFLVN